MGVADDFELELSLRAALMTKPQEPEPEIDRWANWRVGMIEPDPNKTRADIEHPSPVLDKLRAAIANPETSEEDRQAAREVIRISFRGCSERL